MELASIHRIPLEGRGGATPPLRNVKVRIKGLFSFDKPQLNPLPSPQRGEGFFAAGNQLQKTPLLFL